GSQVVPWRKTSLAPTGDHRHTAAGCAISGGTVLKPPPPEAVETSVMTPRFVRVEHDGRPRWGTIRPESDAIDLIGSAPIPLAGAKLLAPCEPTKILGVGTNYRAHALEMNKPLPDEPLLFSKPPSALCAPGEAIVRPRGFQRTDFEGELGVIIGR